MISDCTICRADAGDPDLDRVEVWRDALWRLSMARHGATLGFAYLEPIRHIPHLEDLDGEEAQAFGAAIAKASQTLKQATGASLVYAFVFGGGIPHLHVHLAPNTPEGVLNTAIIAGEVEERPLPSGATEIISKDHPDLPEADVAAVIERVRELMSS